MREAKELTPMAPTSKWPNWKFSPSPSGGCILNCSAYRPGMTSLLLRCSLLSDGSSSFSTNTFFAREGSAYSTVLSFLPLPLTLPSTFFLYSHPAGTT